MSKNQSRNFPRMNTDVTFVLNDSRHDWKWRQIYFIQGRSPCRAPSPSHAQTLHVNIPAAKKYISQFASFYLNANRDVERLLNILSFHSENKGGHKLLHKGQYLLLLSIHTIRSVSELSWRFISSEHLHIPLPTLYKLDYTHDRYWANQDSAHILPCLRN